MGHDISAYIKTKANPNPTEDWETSERIAYFRIGAFNTLRQRLFYGIIPGSDVANAGVSGDGSTLDFTREDIVTAISACKYFMDDDDSLRETILSREHESEETTNKFRDFLQQIFGEIDNSMILTDQSSIDEIREDIGDVWEFCENILSNYDETRREDDSAQIQIYFG